MIIMHSITSMIKYFYLGRGISGTIYSKTSFVLMFLELLDILILGIASSRIEPRRVCN